MNYRYNSRPHLSPHRMISSSEGNFFQVFKYLIDSQRQVVVSPSVVSYHLNEYRYSKQTLIQAMQNSQRETLCRNVPT
jgi:hypothetical protein